MLNPKKETSQHKEFQRQRNLFWLSRHHYHLFREHSSFQKKKLMLIETHRYEEICA